MARKLSEEEIETVAAHWVDVLKVKWDDGTFRTLPYPQKRVSLINLFLCFYYDVQRRESEEE